MDDLEATLAAATPGPWAVSEVQGISNYLSKGGEHKSTYKVTIRHLRYGMFDELNANSALIGMAHDLATEVLRLRARVAELEAERRWQPIETAPMGAQALLLIGGKRYLSAY